MTDQTDRWVRSHGPRTPEDDRTVSLYKAVFFPVMLVLIIIGIIHLGMAVGWLATILTITGGLAIIISFVAMRNWDRIGLFFGNYAAREAAEEEERRLFGRPDEWSMVQPAAKQIADEGINIVGAPILPLHGSDEDPIADYYGGYLEPPPVGEGKRLFDIVLWPRSILIELMTHPLDDATDQAEDMVCWWIAVLVPTFFFIGWCSEGSTVTLAKVIVIYGLSGLLLRNWLILRRNNFNWP